MAIEFRERSVDKILRNVNAFWSQSNLMQDRHVIDQTWRGYTHVFDNLYTQLYQLHFSKSIDTISHSWISHWERFDFNASTQTDTFNSLYPYAYRLPENVKSVYLLRESPREIQILPSLTAVLNTGSIVLPDGSVRLPGDIIYSNEDISNFSIPCPNCDATGVVNDSDICPACKGERSVRGLTSEAGFGVDTVKYYKRADDIADYEETTEPLGDFVVNEEAKVIAFRTRPYEILWSEYAIRDTEIIYDNFGSLLQFHKKDSLKYLRQVQGLWYAYWHGSTIRNLEIGLNLVTDLSFSFEAGFVENITWISNRFLTRKKVNLDHLAASQNIIKLVASPSVNPDTDLYNIDLVLDNKPQYVLTQNVDYEILVHYEDHYDYDNWSSFTSFNEINTVPSSIQSAYVRFFNTIVVQQMETGDDLFIYFHDGSGSYVITINSQDYVISDENVIDLSIGQYVTKWQEFTNDVKVYDYKNYPKWWENLLGYRHALSFFRKYGRLTFDSGVNFDSGINFDSFYEHGALDLFYYHTFLVELSNQALPRSLEDLRVVRAFLDTIKPSYSHYIIRGNIEFSDHVATRQAHFCIESSLSLESVQGPNQRLDDDWARKFYDSKYGFDSYGDWEKLFIAKIPTDGIDFLSDTRVHSAFFDSTEGALLDSGRLFDTNSSQLQISRYRYYDIGKVVDNGVANTLYYLYEIDGGWASWPEYLIDGGGAGGVVMLFLDAGGADAAYELEIDSEFEAYNLLDGGDSPWA